MFSLTYRRLSRLPNYVRPFGPMNGITLLLQIERSLAHRSDKLRSFDIAWAAAPIWLRDTVSDHAIFWQNLVAQHYDISRFTHSVRLASVYDAMVRRGKRPTIIDCGGNIGLSAIWFALKFPEARIVVVEPDLDNFNLLTRNVALYGGRIVPIHGAVWPRPDELAIANPESGAAAFQVRHAASDTGQGIKGYILEMLIHLAGSTDARIVKLDIEGSQQKLFQANTD